MGPQIRLLQNNNTMMAEKIQSIEVIRKMNCTPGKRVGVKSVSQVRILFSPQNEKPCWTKTARLFCYYEHC